MNTRDVYVESHYRSRPGTLTLVKPADHKTADWLQELKDEYRATEEQAAPRPNPATEVGLDSETLRNARSQAFTFAPRETTDKRAWIQSQSSTADAVVENFFMFQQAVIQIGEREYQVCDMARQDAFAVKFEITDNRRFATCGCGSGEMCVHIKTALILHLTLSDARKNMSADDAISLACAISLRTWSRAGQTPFRGVADFAQFHNRRLVRESRILSAGEPF